MQNGYTEPQADTYPMSDLENESKTVQPPKPKRTPKQKAQKSVKEILQRSRQKVATAEQILEDTEVQGVSTIISEASIPTGEDVSDQIVALKVSGYETEHAFVAGSLQVYYNGLNISNTVTEDSNTAFSLSDHYADDMLPASAGDEGDSLWITYVKVQE